MITLVFRILIIISALTVFYTIGQHTKVANNIPLIFDQAASVALIEDSEWENSLEIGNYLSLPDILTDVLQRLEEFSETLTITEPKTAITPLPSNSEIVTSTTKQPTDLGDAIVNIYCTQETEEYRRIISGTGFLISNKGIILTNAHVAQFLLLDGIKGQGEINCSGRTGKIAESVYELSLLYISSTWIAEHADLISNQNPRGTGESDFALLYITGTTDKSDLPKEFTYIPPATNPLKSDMKGRAVVLVGYPTDKIGNIKTGTRVAATTTITELYTFGGGEADVFTLGETPLGHQGASGGPVIDHFGRAFGVITTKEPETTALNAITLSHIDRTMRQENGSDLISTIQGDLSSRSLLFKEKVLPILQSLLKRYLEPAE